MSILWNAERLRIWREVVSNLKDFFGPSNVEKKKIFILGSYRPECLSRLEKLKIEINKKSEFFAFLMSDVKHFISNYIEMFSVLAILSDVIFIVIEHDIGGHMIELGIIISKRGFYDKTYLFVKKGAKVTTMLTEGAFKEPFFIKGKNMFYISSDDELIKYAFYILEKY